jgi:hypothetical protein
MPDRRAVIVRLKKPFPDWLRAVDGDDAPAVTVDQMDATLYLVPDYEDPALSVGVAMGVVGGLVRRVSFGTRHRWSLV